MMEGLGPEKDDIATPWMTPWGNVSVNRVFGLRAKVLGNVANAEHHFKVAIDFCGKAGYRPELAWACYDLAGLLLTRTEKSDQERGKSLLGRAMAIVEELGMNTLSKLIRRRQEEKVPGKQSHPPTVLTNRELEVLGLIAQGKTNQEIAFELFISEHTVGNHVSNILAKTESANRTEAALYGAQHNLLSD
jgi:DNA-binding CsgD family transcriptional regulator